MLDKSMNYSNARGTNLDGNYTFMPYDAKAPVVEKGLRTIKVMYKKNMKTGTIGGNNVCILAKPLDIEEDIKPNIEKLLPYILTLCEAEQDKLVKSFHTSDDVEIIPSSINIEAIINSLEAARTESLRINKELLGSWFDSSMADTLTVLFADKLGISSEPSQEEIKKLESFLNVYKNKYSGLASNLVQYSKDEAEKLITALDKCEIDSGDVVGMKVKEKLIKMVETPNLEEVLGL